jgi:cytochrome P450
MNMDQLFCFSEREYPIESIKSATEAGPRAGRAGGCPVLSGYDPLSPQELRDPYPSLHVAQAYAPVFYDEARRFWSVTRHDDVLAVLRDTTNFSNRMAIPLPLPPDEFRDRMPVYPTAGALLFMDDPEHGPARKMVQAPFTPRRLRAMQPLIRTKAEELLRPSDADRRLEFVRGYATRLALVVIGDILGIPEEHFAMLERVIGTTNRLHGGSYADDEIDGIATELLEYWDYLHEIVAERRRHPTDDFASVLANYASDDGSQPSDDDVAFQMHTILGAGFETSAQMMSFGVRSLLENRDQWELLKADRGLLPRAVEECVRHRTLIKRIFRVALTDVDIGGVPIPEGSLVAIMPAAANHDPSVFDDPERFDLARKQQNLTFGKGMHFCLGAPLSKLEMLTTLETLLDLAPDMQLVADQEIEYVNHIILDGMLGLHVDLGPVPDGAVTALTPAAT